MFSQVMASLLRELCPSKAGGGLMGLSQTPAPGTGRVTQVMSRIHIKPGAPGIGSQGERNGVEHHVLCPRGRGSFSQRREDAVTDGSRDSWFSDMEKNCGLLPFLGFFGFSGVKVKAEPAAFPFRGH